MIFEDQYGVGDVVNDGEAADHQGGHLRRSQLADVNGKVWYRPQRRVAR